MSSTDRQNRLLVAEDWKRIYQSFKNADFTSYDFENLRRVMIAYLRENYPEDFNDYIESSEYLALIDMIAFLGQSFAFRVDLNARENFLELAERRESILRLARTLSYNAKRNKPATGLLKWESISTTEDVIDSNGRNISNQEIVWNDPSNANWLDQFIRVVNAALPMTAQFGSPDASANVFNIPTEQYRLQTIGTSVPVYAFTKSVDGRNMNFELISTVIENSNIVEEPPLAGRRLSFVYRDDGKGAASNSNGFFLMFKQGGLNTGTFTLTEPTTNEIVDIDATNINDSDVWLYKLNANGSESEYWEKVTNFEANNIIYNSVKKNIKNIYNIITRTNDRISLVFSDGIFGNLPLGTFRIYYRTSNGVSYTINPKDMRSVSVDVSYLSNTGQLEVLSIAMSLQTSVANSSPSESDDEIKAKAPATYYTQNRMITAEDYNISPLSVDQDVLKIKTVNRSSSGISRYFDLIDPTGKYSSTDLFSDDGILYREEFEDTFRFTYKNRVDIQAVIINQVLPYLSKISIRNYYYQKFGRIVLDYDPALQIKWQKNTEGTNYSTGKFKNNVGIIFGYNSNNTFKSLEPGALLKFTAPDNYVFLRTENNRLVATSLNLPNTTKYLWAKLVTITNDGLVEQLADGSGPITLNEKVPNNAIITEIIPKWTITLDDTTITLINDLIFNNRDFGLRYDLDTKTWKLVFDTNLNLVDPFNIGRTGDISNQKLDSSWLLSFTTDTERYTVRSRNLRYIFESDKKIRFYYDKTNKVFDTKTNKIIKDKISILNINTIPDSPYTPLNYSIDWEIINEFIGNDGYIDTKKIELTFKDSNDDGVVDDPDIFNLLVSPSTTDPYKFVVLKKYETATGQIDYAWIENLDTDGYRLIDVANSFTSIPSNYFVDKKYVYVYDTDTLFQYDMLLNKFVVSLDYKVYQGRKGLKFHYIHSADYEARIDPGYSNFMDLYVLTKQYDINFRQWLLGSIDQEPMPPSTDQLAITLGSKLEKIKAMSDEIIYHPVRYKILFGSKAISNLRASFKLVKNQEQIISDNDLKSRVLNAINEFFSLENWDFGDSFYFSELVAYIMNRTAPFLVNIVIVPRQENLTFGSLFEIKAENDQIFISGATSEDLEIIDSITTSSLNATGLISTNNTVLSQQFIESRARNN